MNVKLNGGVLVLVLVLSFLLSFSASAVDIELAEDSTLNGVLERGRLRVGFEVGYMPFEMIDKRGGLRQRALRPGDERRGGQHARFIGFDVDIAREMAKALGVDFVPVNTRWTSIIPALNVGRFDIIISGMSITEERKRKVDFSDPYMTIGQTVLLNKKHAGVISSYEQLNDPQYMVTSKPGTTGEEAVQKLLPQATYKPFDTELQAATEVMEGRADAFIYDLPYNATFYAMQGSENLELLDDPFTTESLAWAIRKNDPDFLKWLNGFLAEIKEDGRYEKIYNKWFQSNEWFKYVQ
jgi:polar amino acid transport system substrate-binding protein